MSKTLLNTLDCCLDMATFTATDSERGLSCISPLDLADRSLMLRLLSIGTMNSQFLIMQSIFNQSAIHAQSMLHSKVGILGGVAAELSGAAPNSARRAFKRSHSCCLSPICCFTPSNLDFPSVSCL